MPPQPAADPCRALEEPLQLVWSHADHRGRLGHDAPRLPAAVALAKPADEAPPEDLQIGLGGLRSGAGLLGSRASRAASWTPARDRCLLQGVTVSGTTIPDA